MNELRLGCLHCLMPLSDTITLQSSLQAGVLAKCLCTLSHERNLANFIRIKNNELSSKWKTGLQLSSQGASKSRHLRLLRSVVTKVVETIAPVDNAVPIFQEKDVSIDSGVESGLDRFSVDDMGETPSKEDERRLRISNANKGKIPWNKGRKHSPETLALIRERTKQAMQDPKVRRKLLNFGHPQSEDTRIKIGIAMRKVFKEQRQRKNLQEMCLLEWEESIAEAARLDAHGGDELLWDAYGILKEKMDRDLLQTVEMEKAMDKQKRKDKRAPKSVDQKKKISEAVRAKWAVHH